MSTTFINQSSPEAHAAIEARLRYLGEAEVRMSEVKARARGAAHFLRRHDPAEAANELAHVINEAGKLHLHLAAWDNYMKPAQPTRASS